MQRTSNRAKILKELYHQYIIQHIGEVSPSVADIFAMADFQDIINLGPDVTVTEDTFASVIATLPEVVTNWRKENMDKLAQLVTSSAEAVPTTSSKKGKRKQPNPPSALSVLNLATSVFKCMQSHCCEVFHYQRFFHHRCITSPYQQIGYDQKNLGNHVYFALGYVPHHHTKPFGGVSSIIA